MQICLPAYWDPPSVAQKETGGGSPPVSLLPTENPASKDFIWAFPSVSDSEIGLPCTLPTRE
jgi:hypothetical protein